MKFVVHDEEAYPLLQFLQPQEQPLKRMKMKMKQKKKENIVGFVPHSLLGSLKLSSFFLLLFHWRRRRDN